MFTGTYPVLMAEYSRWMNEKLYAGCARLSDEERKRDRGVFFRSIHSTLNHLVWGDSAWLSRFTARSYPSAPLGEDLHADFGELQRARWLLDADILTWARGVSNEALAEPVTWTSTLYGFTQTVPKLVQVVQMFNHGTHHRGQVHAMLTAAGIDIGPTDVPLVPVLHA
jgi:uncharacterized damage-inducible protein DinB